MAEYSESDLATAQRVVRGLFNRELNIRDLQDGVAIADIEGDTNQFIDNLEFLAELRHRCSCNSYRSARRTITY